MATNNSDLSVSYSAVAELAKDVSQLRQDFSDMRGSLSSLVSDMEKQWQGKAEKEFSTAYNTLKDKLNVIDEVMKHFLSVVLEVPGVFEAADENITF